jgi:cathepsin L
MASSFAYLSINNGVNNASVYPYKETKGACRYNSNFASIELKSFVSLPSGDEEELKNALAAVGPISVTI